MTYTLSGAQHPLRKMVEVVLFRVSGRGLRLAGKEVAMFVERVMYPSQTRMSLEG